MPMTPIGMTPVIRTWKGCYYQCTTNGTTLCPAIPVVMYRTYMLIADPSSSWSRQVNRFLYEQLLQPVP